jgi:type II secretory pathway pseudopilin PulG
MSTLMSSHKFVFILLWKILQPQRSDQPNSTQQGLTIMECLVAIMLIGLTVAMVTPPLLIATATRVQNRRAEQAVKIAQDEVDRINTLVQQGLHQNDRLPAVANVTSGSLKDVSPPSQLAAGLIKTSRQSTSACPPGSAYSSATRYTNQPLKVTDALPVDIDGDCQPEFFIQVFRTAGITTPVEQNSRPNTNTQRPATFDLGVRVYSSLAQANFGSSQLKTDPAPLSITNTRGQQDRAPLAVVYKSMIWGEQSAVLCQALKRADLAKLITSGACQ